MLSFVLFIVIPVLGYGLMLCFTSGKKKFKLLGWTVLSGVTALLTWYWDFIAGLFLIATFIWSMFSMIVGENKHIGVKESVVRFSEYLKIW